ncbi:RTX protein, partial [Vibrio cholerae HC-55B2]
RRAVPLPWS